MKVLGLFFGGLGVMARINDRAGFIEEYDDQDEDTRNEGFEAFTIENLDGAGRNGKPKWRKVQNSKCGGIAAPNENGVFWRCSVLELAKRTKKRCRAFCMNRRKTSFNEDAIRKVICDKELGWRPGGAGRFIAGPFNFDSISCS